MALQKQTITLDFGFGGLDQKPDKLVQPIKFSELQNARFSKIGRIERRKTVETFSSSMTAIKLFSDGTRVAAVVDSTTTPPTICAFDSASASYTAAPDRTWYQRRIAPLPVGELVAERLGATNFASNAPQADRADGANHYCVTLRGTDDVGTVAPMIEIYDKTTNALLYRDYPLFDCRAMRVVAHPLGLRDDFFIAAADSNSTVFFANVSVTLGITYVTTAPSQTACVAGKFDIWACPDPNAATSAVIFIAACQTTGISLQVHSWPTNGDVASTSATVINSANTVTRLCIANHNNATTTSNAMLFWHESVNGLKTATYNHSRTVVLSPASVTTDTTTPNALAGVQLADGTYHVIAGYSGSSSSANYIRPWWINASNTPSSVTGIGDHLGMSLVSKAAAKPGDSYSQFWGCYPAPGGSSNFLLALSSTTLHTTPFASQQQRYSTLGRLFYATAFGELPASHSGVIPNLVYSSSVFTTVLSQSQTTDAIGLFLSGLQYSPRSIKHRSDRGWLSVDDDGSILTTGGYLQMLDPIDGPSPLGPQIYPVISVSAASGGSMAAGSYAFSAVFEMRTSDGRRYMSAPAAPVTVTLTTAQSVTVTFQTYRLRDGMGGAGIGGDGVVKLKVYRTLVNESQVYYKCAEPAGSSTANTVSVNVSVTDSAVGSEEPLYTVGGVFDNWTPSAPIAIASNGRRMLAVAGDRPNFVVQSKPKQQFRGREFFADIGKEIAGGGDRIWGLASYLDRWFAFKQSAIYVATGDGADATGQNDTLSEFQPLTTDLGCVEPRSIVTTPAGIVFRAPSGFYIIGQDMNPRYIGAAIEDSFASFPGSALSTRVVTDAFYDSKNQRAYFATNSPTVFVLSVFETEAGYDLRWSYDRHSSASSNYGHYSVAVVNGRQFLANGPGYPYIVAESLTYYNTSNGFDPDFAFTTAWVPMGGIQGFGRVYKAKVLGTVGAAASVTVTVAVGYDFATTWSETHSIAASAMRNGEFEIPVARQKCQSVRFRVTQAMPSSLTDVGYAPNQIQLEVGIKPPSSRLPASARARKV